MKSIKFPLILILLVVFISCSKKESEKVLSTEEIYTAKYGPVLKGRPIPIRDAAQMISNMLSEPFLEKLATRESFSGYFSVEEFKIKGSNVGVILWPCYNPRKENSLPRFFLALEQVAQYDSIDPGNNKPGNSISVPAEFFTYAKLQYDVSVVEKYLLDDITKPSGVLSPKPIDPAKVTEYIGNFSALMETFAPVKGGSYCQYSQYFFRKNTSYENFSMDKDLSYVRYYMGFVWDDEHKPNYFRPILAGATINGETVKVIASGGAPFLQKSVPPPPPPQ